MPLPKPKKSEPTFPVCPHDLSESAKAELSDLLGRNEDQPNDDEDETSILLDVEILLGEFLPTEANLDYAPRAADYITTFALVRKEAGKLLDSLTSLSGYFRDQFTLQRVEIDKLEMDLETLCDASRLIEKRFESKSSKGAKKDHALTHTILQLRGIFRKHYRGPLEERSKTGAFQKLSEQEKRELEFVRTALRDAGISHSDLSRLFRDRRCIPYDPSSITPPSTAKARAKKSITSKRAAPLAELTKAMDSVTKKAGRTRPQKMAKK